MNAERVEDRIYYFLPKRLILFFAVIEVMARNEYVTTVKIMEETGYSRPYITAFLTELKKTGIVGNSKGGYYFMEGLKGTSIGDIINASFKDEDRSPFAKAIFDYIVDTTSTLTIEELLEKS